MRADVREIARDLRMTVALGFARMFASARPPRLLTGSGPSHPVVFADKRDARPRLLCRESFTVLQ